GLLLFSCPSELEGNPTTLSVSARNAIARFIGDLLSLFRRGQLRKARHVKLRVNAHQEQRSVLADRRALHVEEIEIRVSPEIGVPNLCFIDAAGVRHADGLALLRTWIEAHDA